MRRLRSDIQSLCQAANPAVAGELIDLLLQPDQQVFIFDFDLVNTVGKKFPKASTPFSQFTS